MPRTRRHDALLADLATADTRGLVNLRGRGTRDAGAGFQRLLLSYRPDDTFKDSDDAVSRTQADVIAEAQAGNLVMTFTAALRSGYGTTQFPQPLLKPPVLANDGAERRPGAARGSSRRTTSRAFRLGGIDVHATPDPRRRPRGDRTLTARPAGPSAPPATSRSISPRSRPTACGSCS
jgi:hypothetical protein